MRERREKYFISERGQRERYLERESLHGEKFATESKMPMREEIYFADDISFATSRVFDERGDLTRLFSRVIYRQASLSLMPRAAGHLSFQSLRER